jgi:predicted nucleic acid-binding protein
VRVTDASALFVAVAGGTTRAGSLRNRLHSETLAAPHLLDLEVTNTLRRHVHRSQLSLAEAERAMKRLQRLPIIRHPHSPLLERCWELRDNLTPYDAAYVALAEALDVPLLTSDARLANAPGIRCEVELLT